MGWGRRKVPAAYSSKAIDGLAVEHNKPFNLVSFNWQMTSSLRHNDVITVEILDFYKILQIKIRKIRNVSKFKKITNK